jgi:phage shock protein A
MANILDRFSTIIKSNINALLDKAEDPAKMIDQYLLDLRENLAEVKKETAGVMAEESRCRRMFEENQRDVDKYDGLARKALSAGNEGDAKVFLAKKLELETKGADLKKVYDTAKENADKMRQMHDKLVSDINSLETRKAAIKAKVAVAKTQEKVNEITSGSEKASGTIAAFEQMEAKADQMLDQANAMTELNDKKTDNAESLADKYEKAGSTAEVDDALAKMKQELGL